MRKGTGRVSSYREGASDAFSQRIMRYWMMTCTCRSDIETTPMSLIVIVTSPAAALNRINPSRQGNHQQRPPPAAPPYTDNNSSDTHPATSSHLESERETSVWWKHLLKPLSAVVLASRPRAVNTRSPELVGLRCRLSFSFILNNNGRATEQDVELLLR